MYIFNLIPLLQIVQVLYICTERKHPHIYIHFIRTPSCTYIHSYSEGCTLSSESFITEFNNTKVFLIVNENSDKITRKQKTDTHCASEIEEVS